MYCTYTKGILVHHFDCNLFGVKKIPDFVSEVTHDPTRNLKQVTEAK